MGAPIPIRCKRHKVRPRSNKRCIYQVQYSESPNTVPLPYVYLQHGHKVPFGNGLCFLLLLVLVVLVYERAARAACDDKWSA